MSVKKYSKPPLPFEGNKKLWRKNYKETFKEYKICFILDPPYLYTDKL